MTKQQSPATTTTQIAHLPAAPAPAEPAPRVVRIRIWVALATLIGATLAAFPVSGTQLFSALSFDDASSLLIALPIILCSCTIVSVLRAAEVSTVQLVPRFEPSLLLAVPLLLTACGLSLIGPIRFGFSYWYAHYDLAALEMFFVAASAVLCGVGNTFRTRAGVWLALLCLPPLALPALMLVQRAATSFTSSAAARIADAFGNLGARPLDSGVFATAHGTVSVAAACGGIEGLLAVGLVGAPLITAGIGPRRRKLMIIGGAMITALLVNLLRVVTLLAAAGHNHQTAFAAVHAVAGVVCVVLVAAGMLVAATRSGIHWPRISRRAFVVQVTCERRHIRWLVLIFVTVIVVLAGTQLASSAARNTTLASPSHRPHLQHVQQRWGDSIVPLTVPGYDVVFDSDYQWFQQFFGSAASGEAFTIMHGARATVWAQIVVAPSLRALDNYGPLACFVAHGASISRVQNLALPGGAGVLVEQSQRGVHFVALTFTQPVIMPNKHNGYRRTVLFTRAAPRSSRARTTDATAPQGSLADRFAVAVLNAFSPVHTRSTPHWNYAAADDQLQQVARSIIQSGK